MSTDQALALATVVVFTALALAWIRLRLWQASHTLATALAEELDLDDHAPGTDVGWQDECELIWATPDTREQWKDEQS